MTQEQKAKRYDEALERAKSMIDDLRKGEDILAVSDLESMFPELEEESEDEKIRKALIAVLKSDFETDTTIYDISVGEILAWLEKQGEQKPAWSEEDGEMVEDIIEAIDTQYAFTDYNEMVDWLKSLKDRVGCEAICTTTWKPSEEQISLLKEAINIVGSKYKSCLNSLYSDLKKL